jgi:hypothetical protein
VIRNRAIAVGALTGAIAGAIAGACLQRFWAAEPIDADDFGMRLERLEIEIEELEQLQRARRRRAEDEGGGGAAFSRIPSAGQRVRETSEHRV